MATAANIRIVQLSNLEDPKVKQAASILGEAFSDDVIANNLVGGREELKSITYNTIVRATIVGGLLYVAVDDNDQVVGTACWFPPGSDFLADEKQREQGATDLFVALQKVDPALFNWWMTTLLPNTSGITNKYLNHSGENNFKLNNWNVYSLTVKPSFQGQGIAKRLLKVGEDKAIAQGLSTTFETDNEQNISIYTHLGYMDVGSDYVDGPPELPGYRIHVLVKHPQDFVRS